MLMPHSAQVQTGVSCKRRRPIAVPSVRVVPVRPKSLSVHPFPLPFPLPFAAPNPDKPWMAVASEETCACNVARIETVGAAVVIEKEAENKGTGQDKGPMGGQGERGRVLKSTKPAQTALA